MKTLALVSLLALALAGCGHAVTPTAGTPTSYLNTPPPPPPNYLK